MVVAVAATTVIAQTHPREPKQSRSREASELWKTQNTSRSVVYFKFRPANRCPIRINDKEPEMELKVEEPQEEKIDFAVLYGGKVAL
ncbi:hypothetical protein ESZ53_07855 [Salinibacterium sp. UTAS2018]|uniref:hypothetical protein n=1 Tax=Salinibacterium sp. UTAS2018 TaxID=2508880 RepID=UPI0010094464|nr:hypothetical protein [Salinibacterium sp. UTAS2018]QAV70363.1 hypothetical protein ESZ53_07855 [Salinibacterium sp. UTAS2018]